MCIRRPAVQPDGREAVFDSSLPRQRSGNIPPLFLKRNRGRGEGKNFFSVKKVFPFPPTPLPLEHFQSRLQGGIFVVKFSGKLAVVDGFEDFFEFYLRRDTVGDQVFAADERGREGLSFS